MQAILIREQRPPYSGDPFDRNQNSSDSTRLIHDSGNKHLLSNKSVFLQFLRRFFASTLPWVKSISEDQMELLPTEFVKDNFRKISVDLLYRIHTSDGADWYFVVFEHQSTIDKKIAVRFLDVIIETWRGRLARSTPHELQSPMYTMPMVVPIVLYNGHDRWKQPQQLTLVFFQNGRGTPLTISLDYLLLDVHRLGKEQLLDTIDMLSGVFLVDQTIDKSPPETIEKLRHFFLHWHNYTETEYRLFLDWLANMVSARIGHSEGQIKDIITNTTQGKEENMMAKVQNAWQKAIEDARIAGMQAGLNEGKLEGKLEGQKQLARQLLASGAVDIATIAKATGIPEDEIRTWVQ